MPKISMRALGRELGISAGLVSRLARAGMPIDEAAKAKAWRGLYVRRRRKANQKEGELVVNMYDTREGEAELESAIPRLRRLERSVGDALLRALEADKVAEAASLRREHCGILKTLYDCEMKQLRFDLNRGKLVETSVALEMVDAALKEVVMNLRRLPDLGRDAVEKAKLEAFLSGVLDSMKAGAQRAWKNSRAG